VVTSWLRAPDQPGATDATEGAYVMKDIFSRDFEQHSMAGLVVPVIAAFIVTALLLFTATVAQL
jgi:hypothetical protein